VVVRRWGGAVNVALLPFNKWHFGWLIRSHVNHVCRRLLGAAFFFGATMTKFFLDYDPLAEAVETFEYDEGEDRIIVKRTADVQPQIDFNKYRANHTDGWVRDGIGDERNMRLAASIPIDVALLWLQQYGVSCWKSEHWPAVKRLLADPDWRYLRTGSFKL